MTAMSVSGNLTPGLSCAIAASFHFLIAMSVVLLLIASIAVGVIVAKWPDLLLSWQPDRAR